MAIADMPLEVFKSKQRIAEKKEASQLELPSPPSGTLSEAASRTTSNADVSSVSTSKLTDLSSVPTETREIALESDDKLGPLSDKEPFPTMSTITTSETQLSSAPRRSRTRAASNHLKEVLSRRDSSPVGVSIEAIAGTGRGVERIVSTGVRSPMNFCLGLAKGFRNIPRLYNDETVRPVEKVTDFNSGLKVATRELGLGFYDGIAGLITQPLRGAEKEGAGGLLKGFGKGFGV